LTTKDDAGKNIFDLEKTKRQLEEQVNSLLNQVEVLEDAVQAAEDAKLRSEVQLQAVRREHDDGLTQLEHDNEDRRRALVRQIRDLEEQLDKERSSKVLFFSFPI
jgi:myosin protein heavy chain